MPPERADRPAIPDLDVVPERRDLALVRDRTAGIIAIAMSFPLGLAMVLGNINGLLLLGYVLVWKYRERPWVGALIAVMGVAKIVPFVLIGFLATRHDRKALIWFMGGCVASLGVSILGAGWHAHLDYLGVLATSLPQPLSLPELLGAPWVSPAILIVGTIVAASLPSAWSFRVAIATIVLGTPAVGIAIASQLFALLAPSSVSVVLRLKRPSMILAHVDETAGASRYGAVGGEIGLQVPALSIPQSNTR